MYRVTGKSMKSRLVPLTVLGVVVGSLGLAGCNQRETTDARDSTYRAGEQIDQKTREVGADASRGVNEAAKATREAARDVKDATQAAGDKIGDQMADGLITTSIKAELAKDRSLSALSINVDTEAGRVALRGTAPTAEAREHATALATAVKGVVSVDNRLQVDSGKR